MRMCSRFAGKLRLYEVGQCFAVCLIEVEGLLNEIDEKHCRKTLWLPRNKKVFS